MTRSAAFTQSDLRRAVKGVMAAGVVVAEVEIDPVGKIVLKIARPADDQRANEWDEVLAK